MTKTEREQIIKAMDLFSSDGDDWEGGMNILRKLIGTSPLYEGMKDAKTISLKDLLRGR